MFESAIQRFGRAIRRAGAFEVGEHVGSPLLQGAAATGACPAAGRVVDEAPLAFGEDRGVRGVPRHPETGGGARDGEVVDHDRKCGAEGAPRDTVTRPLAHEPFGHRPTTLLIRVSDPAAGDLARGAAALDHRPIWLETLPNGLEAELVETAERGLVGRGEGSVVQVEVFRRWAV